VAREVISIVNVWCDNVGRHGTDKVAAMKNVTLAYDGNLVRLDLCDECRDEMASVLGEYAEYGEVVPVSRTAKIDTAWTDVEQNDAVAAPSAKKTAKRPAPAPTGRRRPHESVSVSEVRAWLREHTDDHKFAVPERGPRLSGKLNAVYDRGHGWDEVDGTWAPAAELAGDGLGSEGSGSDQAAERVPTSV
jgi:hypothetical protein